MLVLTVHTKSTHRAQSIGVESMKGGEITGFKLRRMACHKIIVPLKNAPPGPFLVSPHTWHWRPAVWTVWQAVSMYVQGKVNPDPIHHTQTHTHKMKRQQGCPAWELDGVHYRSLPRHPSVRLSHTNSTAPSKQTYMHTYKAWTVTKKM
jgi:hypothetical protein